MYNNIYLWGLDCQSDKTSNLKTTIFDHFLTFYRSNDLSDNPLVYNTSENSDFNVLVAPEKSEDHQNFYSSS